MQDAADAAALAVSKIAASATPTQITAAAQKYFNVNFNDSDAKGVTVNASYTAVPTAVTVTGSANLDTYFLGLAGLPNLMVFEVLAGVRLHHLDRLQALLQR